MNLSVKSVHRIARFLVIGLLATTWACPWDDFDNSAVNEFAESWHAGAQRMQRDLQIDVPIRQSTYLYTHNAYNAEAYQDWTIRYQFPNQIYSIYDQMRLGSRVLELDLHYTLGTKFKKEVLLCHGTSALGSDDIGCVIWDRVLDEGLEEIRNFMQEEGNEDEILVIIFEEYLDNSNGENKTLSALKNILGDMIYKPDDGAGDVDKSIINKTNRDILDAGKNIIVYGHTDAANHDVAEWGEWIHNGFVSGAPNGIGTSIETWREKWAEGYYGDEDRDYFNARWVRNNNDATDYGIFHEPVFTESHEMIKLIESGVNAVEADLFDVAHAKNAVWSWGEGLPDNSGGNQNCAALMSNNRWDDKNCAAINNFACRGDYYDWQITSGTGAWEEGIQACYEEFGAEYSFAVPISGLDNRKLYEARNEAGAGEVWINYSDQDSEGEWQVLNVDTSVLANDAPLASLLQYQLSAANVNAILGDEVTSWTDDIDGLSLTGANGPTYSPIAINGKPALDFESGDSLTSADNATGVAAQTVFAVVDSGSGAQVVQGPGFVTATNGAPLSLSGFDGNVAEVLIYGANLDSGDIDAVVSHLEDKYGL